ncbi:MAG: 4-deoxy-4-formamido-L-arabinose-phosphoundecaprenol deformylase [Betaproteobacteria bacterium]|nr:4-deoxy-4-formamido-L-arabinose-phosphoundecaprenol deformylase [Betaproteobacteria bacterium]
MSIALKVDVDTLRGTREGVPRLVETLRRHAAGATFLFSLGPDHTGRAIRRAFRPGFMRKVGRTSVLEHYGLRTLLYGTVLPGPDIGRRAHAEMLAARDAGFEVGVHCWDHVAWQDGVASANASWTAAAMNRAIERFGAVFGEAPRVHGAAGWQMNVEALRLTQRLGFDYASDCRGTHPFLPTWNAELIHCPQFPTTLPTLDELIGCAGHTVENVAEHLLDLTAAMPGRDQVFTLHAELEGQKLLPVFERLLAGWSSQGRACVPLRAFFERQMPTDLPRHEIALGEVFGRAGMVLVQGAEFLAEPHSPNARTHAVRFDPEMLSPS